MINNVFVSMSHVLTVKSEGSQYLK